MKKIFKFIAASCLMASVLSGCTGKFEEYNKKATYAIPGEIIPQLYSKLEKADDFTKMAIIQQYFEQYVLIPHSVANR